MITCELARTFIQEKLDRILSQKDEEQLQNHINSCLTCLHEYEIYQRLISSFEKLPSLEFSETLSQKIMNEIMKEPQVPLVKVKTEPKPMIEKIAIVFAIVIISITIYLQKDKTHFTIPVWLFPYFLSALSLLVHVIPNGKVSFERRYSL